MKLPRTLSNPLLWIGACAIVLNGCATTPPATSTVQITPEYVCHNHLQQIAQAKRYWIIDNPNGPYPHPSFFIGPGLYLPAMPQCPSGGEYNPGGRHSDSKCSFHGARADIRKAERRAESK